MKKVLLFAVVLLVGIGLAGCKKSGANVAEVIRQAESMTYEEVMQKAYEESNGKSIDGIGNSSRGKKAGPTFIEKMKEKFPDYKVEFTWQQPKENTIFESFKSGQYFMTLIQDGAQIQAKMLDTGILLNYMPKEWKEANGVDVANNGNPLALQTLNKVFMYNILNKEGGEAAYGNVWDFVAEGQAPMFMGLDSEPVGKNFLLMLTEDKYVKIVKAAYDALPDAKKEFFKPAIDELKAKAGELKLGQDAEYSLAWIKHFVTQMNVQTDDGPICTALTKKTAKGETGLLVYSKLRSTQESEDVSKNNIKVAAYEDGYQGFGGYAYKHYLLIPKNSKFPWTACAFINYMVTDAVGFSPWGKDIGGYSSNPNITPDHSKDGYAEDGVTIEYPAINDRGERWWLDTGKLVVEEPKYCAKVKFTVGTWIDGLKK